MLAMLLFSGCGRSRFVRFVINRGLSAVIQSMDIPSTSIAFSYTFKTSHEVALREKGSPQ